MWGRGSFGRLGTGPEKDHYAPVEILLPGQRKSHRNCHPPPVCDAGPHKSCRPQRRHASKRDTGRCSLEGLCMPAAGWRRKRLAPCATVPKNASGVSSKSATVRLGHVLSAKGLMYVVAFPRRRPGQVARDLRGVRRAALPRARAARQQRLRPRRAHAPGAFVAHPPPPAVNVAFTPSQRILLWCLGARRQCWLAQGMQD